MQCYGKTVGMTISAMLVAMTATSVAAQTYGAWYGGGMGPGMMGGSGRAALIDQNADGRISDDEAASAAEEAFVAMDADDDQVLTKDEYFSVQMKRGFGWNVERQAAMQERREKRFAELDSDKNNSVSRIEFMNAAKENHDAADLDGDGDVSPWEYRQRAWP